MPMLESLPAAFAFRRSLGRLLGVFLALLGSIASDEGFGIASRRFGAFVGVLTIGFRSVDGSDDFLDDSRLGETDSSFSFLIGSESKGSSSSSSVLYSRNCCSLSGSCLFGSTCSSWCDLGCPSLLIRSTSAVALSTATWRAPNRYSIDFSNDLLSDLMSSPPNSYSNGWLPY